MQGLHVFALYKYYDSIAREHPVKSRNDSAKVGQADIVKNSELLTGWVKKIHKSETLERKNRYEYIYNS